MKCQYCDQSGEDVQEYTFPDGLATITACPIHAADMGFCYMCGYFSAGVESYDFSPLRGVCGECLEDIRYEWGEYDDDEEYYEY